MEITDELLDLICHMDGCSTRLVHSEISSTIKKKLSIVLSFNPLDENPTEDDKWFSIVDIIQFLRQKLSESVRALIHLVYYYDTRGWVFFLFNEFRNSFFFFLHTITHQFYFFKVQFNKSLRWNCNFLRSCNWKVRYFKTNG